MSEKTNIQWCDSTINPVMGCGGCELFPAPAEVIRQIDASLAMTGACIKNRALLTELVRRQYGKIKNPEASHSPSLTTTNIWHVREQLRDTVARLHGRNAVRAVMEAIQRSIACYAAKLHLNRGTSIVRPGRHVNKGYAPVFERVTRFEGRMAKAAGWKDLLGRKNPVEPWKDGLARMIFVSDMGDALSSKGQFAYLEREVVPAFASEEGSRHLWLWLTKRPHLMREFAARIGGFPRNVCAMTTLTGPETLHRVDELRQVDASCHGLSVEPLWEHIPPADLDLRGIDWLILGGESGSGKLTRPFHLEWAEELHQRCRKHGVAFFLKQLGRNPVRKGKPIRLADPHGGDWNEWPDHLRVREFPAYFHAYRHSGL